MATSYERRPDHGPSGDYSPRHEYSNRARRRGPLLFLGALLLAGIVVVVAAIVLVSSSGSISSDTNALARLNLPDGGGTIGNVEATGPRGKAIPLSVRGREVYPVHRIRAGMQVQLTATVTRPGWISWLSGKTERLHATVTTPATLLQSKFLTLQSGSPVRITFVDPVSTVSYGTPGHLVRHVLASPSTTVNLPRSGPAGTIAVAATPRSWESGVSALVSYFPAGTGTTAVASPAPGAPLTPTSKLTVMFSKPVSAATNGHMPTVSPAGSGSWKRISSHSIEFVPTGYGYGLGASVSVTMPSGVKLITNQSGASSATGNWSVPGGSTLRLQQVLAQLGYLPFKFRPDDPASVRKTPAGQEKAAIDAPSGRFSPAYPNMPGDLTGMFSPGADNTIVQAAVMQYENDHNLDYGSDGTATSQAVLWRSLITSVDTGQRSHFGYTFVMVSEGSPESESTWHSGKTVVSGPVNTGGASSPTATGIYPVFEHIPVTTMSGTNPDGSHYDDPGIKWVSYFNGGDALHYFDRGSYGYPQSDGCVEMPLGEAGAVYPYTPIGTLVDVS